VSAPTDDFVIRAARSEDVPLLLQFIRELAEYEKLSAEVSATEAQLQKTLFRPKPYASALLARCGGEPAGFAVYFFSYSTFLAQPTLYVEDVFVRPERRGRGIGRALFLEMFRIAKREGCGRVEWNVLDWNTPSIAFYERLGATIQREWLKCSLSVKNLPEGG
jgi:GNAT superfamily N-acetyltransferase